MRKSNCCKAELLPRTVLCSRCLSEVKVKKLTAEDFIKDNVLNLPFKETLSEISSVVFNGPRFNKTLIIKFELDKDGMYKYNLPEDMDKIIVEQRTSYVVKYGKHVNKIKSLDEVGLTFFIRNNQVIVDAQEFTKLKKSDLVLTFKYGKKNESPSEKIDVCDREKSLKSFIYNLNIAGIENISKDRNKILKSNVDFIQLLSYANMNLHVTKFMDLGNGEVHVDFGIGFLPSTRPSVFTFITKWEYLDQILIKKMVVPISPVPKVKESLDTLPFPIKIGDKVLFQNRHVLLKYFNIGYHVLNATFDNKYIILHISKMGELFIITISDNYDTYKSHPLSHVDIFTLFGSDNTLGVIVNPIQQYGRKATPMQSAPYPFGPVNMNPGFIESGQIHKDNMKSIYNLDGMGYLKAMERKMDNKPKETTGKGERAKINFADESGFFKTGNTEDKKFDEPIKDEKIVPARIGDDNLFSIGDYVTIKYKDLEKGIANGNIKNPFGWEFFENERCFRIYNLFLNVSNTEYTFVLDFDGKYCGLTIEADKVKEIMVKRPLTVTYKNAEEDKVDNTIKPKTKGRKIDKEKGETKNSF